MLLKKDQIEQFIETGYVKVENVFSKELARRILDIVWNELNIDPQNSATWPGYRVVLEKVLEQAPAPEIITERYENAVNDVCGSGRWSATRGAGYFPILFPGFYNAPWTPPSSGWHFDGDLFRQIDSDNLGLVGLEIFSDIPAGGGSTVVRSGSHSIIVRLLAEHRFDQNDERKMSSLLDSATKDLPVVELTGNTGDVFLLHPFTLHAESRNCSDQIRIIAVKLVRLKERMNLHRGDPNEYSPIELAIVKAIGQG
jgi:ectoine hydroxylase-related dioxygenase (phytanoyl-CoA dioxygenase family)